MMPAVGTVGSVKAWLISNSQPDQQEDHVCSLVLGTATNPFPFRKGKTKKLCRKQQETSHSVLFNSTESIWQGDVDISLPTISWDQWKLPSCRLEDTHGLRPLHGRLTSWSIRRCLLRTRCCTHSRTNEISFGKRNCWRDLMHETKNHPIHHYEKHAISGR